MSNVAFLVDLDGFRVAGRFYTREMGIVPMAHTTIHLWRFDLRRSFTKEEISPQDRRCITYVQRNIHGMSLYPTPYERVHQHEEIPAIIRRMYETYATEDRNLVGYKGGTVEASILHDLGLPSLNIESLGCPKYDCLREKYPVDITCGYSHSKMLNGNTHCALAEVITFKRWIQDKVNH